MSCDGLLLRIRLKTPAKTDEEAANEPWKENCSVYPAEVDTLISFTFWLPELMINMYKPGIPRAGQNLRVCDVEPMYP